MRRAADRLPTFTFMVQEALRAADDFMTVAQLRAVVPDLTGNRATASLSHLRKFRAADFMVDHDGTTYWFATPAGDARTFVREEKVREEPGTRNRRPRAPKEPKP